MKKIINICLSVMLALSMFIGNVEITPLFALGAQTTSYKVMEDAYIRSDKGTTNYNYENITSAHGSQYSGLNYKVLNIKNSGLNIIPVMKFNLPTKEEVETNGFDTYQFNFNIFKNPNINVGDQIYHFYYIEDCSWSETTITYNTKPATMTSDANHLFDFTVLMGTEYEKMDEAGQNIKVDISDTITSLIDKGVTQMTIFAMAETSQNNSLMIHSRESADGSKAASIEASDENRSVYPISEDAYIRSGKATTNYNYENITSAHGSQYNGKNYKVLNTKNATASGTIQTMMKLPLPTKEEVEANGLNQYHFEFNIFKNADPETGDQTYYFDYTTNNDWNETTVTHNTAPSDVTGHQGNELFHFDITKDFAYETKGKDMQKQRIDVTSVITPLIEQGVSEITIYTYAKNDLNTSLMMHSKESGDGSLTPRLIASKMVCEKADVESLINEALQYDDSIYSDDSYAQLQSAITNAQNVCANDTSSNDDYWNAYQALQDAIASLVIDIDTSDPENIAYGKPTRSNLSKSTTNLVTDGDLSTNWKGKFYPSYVDVDLMDTYDLDKVELYVPSGKTVWYSLYGSNDGEHYDRLYQSRSNAVTDGSALSITFDEAKSYRILRAYMEYTKGEDYAYLSELKAYGTPTDTNKETLRDGSLEEILNMQAYEDSAYASAITEAETIENVYGIIDRVIGAEYRDWFSFTLKANSENDNDYFTLSDQDGKIHIQGNEGLSLARGLNHYLKYYAHVLVSQQTISGDMPESIVPIGEIVRKETPYSIRYAYNYCTLSYTYAFYGEEEWQRENDWLALSGVNVVLDLAGQEATWIKFLMNFGYSFDDAKDWLTGPSYYAWQFMDNMESFGGPIPDDYVIDRVELARKSQRWKNSLGMQTILQGYAGMVPTNFTEFVDDVTVISQGGWNGFSRPSMIATDSDTYDEYAQLFYKAQEFVYGKRNHYYAVDPFHEGGIRPSGLSDETISKEVLKSMIAYDEEAVWVVQGWQSNPTNALLNGMSEYKEDHVLIVDLIKYAIPSATKYDGTTYGSTTLEQNEFNQTPWAWTLLGNFGGNPTMNAQIEIMVNDIINASKTCNYMKGLGVISEAMNDNPMVYALIFDLAWENEDFDLDQWIKDYLTSRYGSVTENILLAWDTIKDSAYNHGVRFTAEVYGTKNKTPQSYGTQSISYGAENLETALRLMLRDFDQYQNNEGYLYDLNEMMRQHVSNYSVLKYNEVLTAKNNSDLDTFKTKKAEFIRSLEVLNLVASTQQEQLGGEWIGKASDRSANYDDFSKDAFEMNAKTLITTWGSYAGHRSLKDYGWRNYEGIFADIYAANWIEYLNRVEANLESGAALNNLTVNDYFPIYWQWVMGDQEYLRDAKDSGSEIKAVATTVLSDCAISGGIDANIGNLALNGTSAIPDMDISDSIDVHDGSTQSTITLNDAQNKEIIIDLLAHFNFASTNVVYGQDMSETLNNVVVAVSDDRETWTPLVANALEEANGYEYKGYEGTYRYVKVTTTLDTFTISEIRAYGERILPDLAMLEELSQAAHGLKYHGDENDVEAFVNALENADEGIANQAAVDEVNSLYWTLYDSICELTLVDVYNIALNKGVVAHNDPSGNSARLTDGDITLHWDAGRLSATGKPYEDTITEGWAVIDLEKYYSLKSIEILFKTTDYWHKYEVYTSLDGIEYHLVGAKTTETTPNTNEDTYVTNNIARYVKIQLKDVQEGSDGKRIGIQVGELFVYGKDYVVDTSLLEETIAKAEAIDQSIYTAESLIVFNEAYTNAQTIVEQSLVLQEEVDEVTNALNDAIKQLEKLPTSLTLEASQVNYKTIQLSWNEVEYANTYIVERFSGNEWILVGTTSETSYQHAGVKTGKQYTYRVKTVVAEKEVVSEEVSFTTSLEGEVELSITNQTSNVFDLTWTSVDGATRYIIYRKNNDGAWKKVLTLGKDVRNYTTKAMREGTYTYQVKAARYDSVDRVMTQGSNEVEVIASENLQLNMSQNDNETLTLTWNQLASMQYYQVYRATSIDGTYRLLKRTAYTTMNTSISKEKTYYYKVRGCYQVNGTNVYSAYSNVVSTIE